MIPLWLKARGFDEAAGAGPLRGGPFSNIIVKARRIEPLRRKTASLAHFIVIVSRRRPRYGSFRFRELHPNWQFCGRRVSSAIKRPKGRGLPRRGAGMAAAATAFLKNR